MITEEIKNYVFDECQNPGNALGRAFFDRHILKVVEYSKKLAGILSADIEVVELSAYLHDISAVKEITSLPEHNVLSAEIAKNILLKKNYSKEKTLQVIQAIKTHITPVQIGNGSLEDVCLSNADAMSQITMPAYWLYFVFVVRKSPFEQGSEWLQNRIDSNWKALIDPAKEIIRNEYEMTKIFTVR